MGDAAQLGRSLGGDVAVQEPDGVDPGGTRLAAVLEDGSSERARRRRPHRSFAFRQLLLRATGTRRRSGPSQAPKVFALPI